MTWMGATGSADDPVEASTAGTAGDRGQNSVDAGVPDGNEQATTGDKVRTVENEERDPPGNGVAKVEPSDSKTTKENLEFVREQAQETLDSVQRQAQESLDQVLENLEKQEGSTKIRRKGERNSDWDVEFIMSTE